MFGVPIKSTFQDLSNIYILVIYCTHPYCHSDVQANLTNFIIVNTCSCYKSSWTIIDLASNNEQ